MELKIVRKRWLRGKDSINMDGNHDSYLRRPRDGKQCCLGFHARACKVPIKDILGRGMPYSLSENAKKKLPAWMLKRKIVNAIADLNDNRTLTEPVRERKIAAHFAKHGVKVTFV